MKKPECSVKVYGQRLASYWRPKDSPDRDEPEPLKTDERKRFFNREHYRRKKAALKRQPSER